MLSFNLVKPVMLETRVFDKEESLVKEIKTIDYIKKLCLCSGTTLKGSLSASGELLLNQRKLPIYLAIFDDYLIPLSSPLSNNCYWFSAKRYLTCFEEKGRFYIKFIDRSIVEVDVSTYTIKNQYNKYLLLEENRMKVVQELI